jgi:hypothetical protein
VPPLDEPKGRDASEASPRSAETASTEAETTQPPPSERPSRVPERIVRLEARGEGVAPLVFKQGAHPPFGIRWYGITSLFGHLRGFVSRFIASESVDSRDWMRPESPQALLRAVSHELAQPGLPVPDATSLVEALGRPLWVDFAADTGDDRDVSRAVGQMLSADYVMPSGEGDRLLPRGELLLMGGDVAYPVATADEIYRRLVLPWNEAFREAKDRATPRVLLGVPGNHDWYDGLDGFGRLFRRRMAERFIADDRERSTRIERRLARRKGRKVGLFARQLHLDEVSGLLELVVAVLRSFRNVFTGRTAKKRRRLVLRGYVPLQEASYFALPLAPGLDLFGVDRQLGQLDFRQRAYFKRRRKEHPDHAVFFLSADPALAYGERNDPGARALSASRLSMEKDRVFFISGDFHHYERRTVGRSLHVIAGGGGAFLHGTRINEPPMGPPDVAYPDAKTSRELALGAPWKLMAGRAGLLVHVTSAAIAALVLAAARHGATSLHVTSAALAVLLVVGLYFVAHQGTAKKGIFALAVPFGVGLGLLPLGVRSVLPRVVEGHLTGDGAVIGATAVVGAFLFGLYLTVLAVLGLEHQQAFTVLGHPGFKHFVRLCIHPDGKIEGFVVGKDDMLVEGAPKLVDSFVWNPKSDGAAKP